MFAALYQVITACGHKVGWLIAKKSWDRTVPGFFARAMSCIPVVRPQVTNMPMCLCCLALDSLGKPNVLLLCHCALPTALNKQVALRLNVVN